MENTRSSPSSRTYRDSSTATRGETSPLLSRDWLAARSLFPPADGEPVVLSSDHWGRPPGACSTLNISEWPNDAAVCSLSTILEENVPAKYSLSARACQGILRRAEKRGKKLPPLLEAALVAVAGRQTQTE